MGLNSDSSKHFARVADSSIEYHETDWHFAFTALAPLVTEALAYLKCGETNKAMDALDSAKDLITGIALPVAFLSNTWTEP